jgi:hypothetical protein
LLVGGTIDDPRGVEHGDIRVGPTRIRPLFLIEGLARSSRRAGSTVIFASASIRASACFSRT